MRLSGQILRSIFSFLFFLLFCLPFSSPLLAEEEILSFTSRIIVGENSTIVVEEAIQVRTERKQIKRGIYRDFPTHRSTVLGLKRGSDFRVVSVTRDGVPENFVVENIQGGIGGDQGKRIRIGNKNVILPPGVYTYKIEYQTTNQIDYEDYYDEFFWNVTGSGWAFPIRRAAAYVSLPDGISQNDVTLGGFTGPPGSKEQSIRTSVERPYYYVESQRQLFPGEGFTILVQWPKGFVYEPSAREQWQRWFLDNKGSCFAMLGFLAVLAYYYLVWREVGKDPDSGTIIPLYEAPEDLSPSEIRYLHKMGFDKKALTAEILDMAVKGYLTISKAASQYTLEKTGQHEDALTDLQKEIGKALFSYSTSIVLKQSNYKTFQKTVKKIHDSLKMNHLKRHFSLNRVYFFWGTALSVVVIFLSALLHSAESFAMTAFMSVWLSGWSLGVFALLSQVKDLWMQVLRGEALALIGAIFVSVFCLPFVAGWIFGAYLFMSASGVVIGLTTIALGATGYLFYHLLKAPTLRGQRIRDKIEGFKLYLGVAEKELLQYAHPPDKTPEVFEKFLPFALALDVEQEWAEKFSDVLSSAAMTQAQSGYHPSFYHGSDFSNLSSFSSSIGNSFSSALSSASSSPRSSGGGGGGGGSGGGGGGGGGGGW